MNIESALHALPTVLDALPRSDPQHARACRRAVARHHQRNGAFQGVSWF